MHVELSIVIPAPVEKVWAVAQDPARRPLWDQRVAAYNWLGPNPKTPGDEHATECQGGSSGEQVGAGSEIAMVVRMGLLRPEARGKMLRWNLLRRLRRMAMAEG